MTTLGSAGRTPRAGALASSAGLCRTTPGHGGRGATAGIAAAVCTDTGLTFIRRAIAQVATTIGPTIISPVVMSDVVRPAGNGRIG
jgi:hypothetical protein